MKKITINHKVEITNNVFGLIYVILQYTKLHSDDLENEFVEVRCYNSQTGYEVFRHEMKFSLYPMAKKKLKSIILECLPCE